VQHVLSSLLLRSREIHDSDIAWLVDNERHLVGLDANSAWPAASTLTPTQRVTLLRSGRPVLAVVAACAWTPHDQDDAFSEEQTLFRQAIHAKHGERIVLALGPNIELVLGADWLIAQLEKMTPGAAGEFTSAMACAHRDRLNDSWAWAMRNVVRCMGESLYLALGRYLTSQDLVEWCLVRDAALASRLIDSIGPDRLLAAIGPELDDPLRCARLPGLPAVIASADSPPPWTHQLISSCMGAELRSLQRAQRIVARGFAGSFEDLRVAVAPRRRLRLRRREKQ
jgi:hypothetical protein